MISAWAVLPAVDSDTPSVEQLAQQLADNTPKTHADLRTVANALYAKGLAPLQVEGLVAAVAIEIRDPDMLEAVALELETFSTTQPTFGTVESWFKDQQDLEATPHLLRAVAALERKDSEAFESEIKQAFWISPRGGEFFGEFVTKERERQARANLRLPLDTPFTDASGSQITLRQILGDNQAIVLEFWAEWCGACISQLPEFVKMAGRFADREIAFATVNIEPDATSATFLQSRTLRGLTWLLDNENASLAKLLGVEAIPSAVVVDRDGRILHFGHPTDPKILTVLELNAKATPPVEDAFYEVASISVE